MIKFIPIGLRLIIKLLKVVEIGECCLRVVVVEQILAEISLRFGGIELHLYIIAEQRVFLETPIDVCLFVVLTR